MQQAATLAAPRGLAITPVAWRASAAWLTQAAESLATAQARRLALWLPVFMGAGVLLYFNLRAEPPPWIGAAIALPAGLGAARAPFWPRVLLAPVAAAAIGFASAQLATLRAPPVERLPRQAIILTARIQGVDLLPEGRRVTLADAHYDGGTTAFRRRLRIRLRNNDPANLTEGDTIRVRALVQEPSPPAYPGAWDIQRDAFYAGMGGYGFALGPVEIMARHPRDGPAARLQALRETIAARFQAALPGAPGAVASTLFTGMQAAIPEADREAFRGSGLAHLLAVAGLHIGIIMGLILGAVRLSLACWEYAALHWPTRQIASLLALAGGGFYMALTGMHVPIMRSFAMACLFTLAVCVGRPAISLRGLALAAAALMLVAPQEVPGVSFQMSFSAVLALIAGYEALRPRLHTLYGDGSPRRRFTLHVVGLALTSLLAGTASAPYGAYHFGHIQLWFVLANMIAVPLTALWVMPAGLIALALLPFGLERLALVPMGWGVQLILLIAHGAAALPWATLDVPHMPGWGLVILSLGIATLGLWQGPWRLTGVALIAAGLLSPALTRPPDLLVSADARLVGLRTTQGIFVEHASGASKFTRDAWTQFWASGPPMPLPGTGTAADGAISCTGPTAPPRPRSRKPPAALVCTLRPRPGAATILLLREDADRVGCGGAAAVIALDGWPRNCPRGVPVLTRWTLRRDGAAAIWLDPAGVTLLTDRAARGTRPWIPPADEPRPSVPPNLPMAPAGA